MVATVHTFKNDRQLNITLRTFYLATSVDIGKLSFYFLRLLYFFDLRRLETCPKIKSRCSTYLSDDKRVSCVLGSYFDLTRESKEIRDKSSLDTLELNRIAGSGPGCRSVTFVRAFGDEK